MTSEPRREGSPCAPPAPAHRPLCGGPPAPDGSRASAPRRRSEVFAGVLVGGFGRRMGGVDKARLRCGDTTLLGRLVRALSPNVRDIVLAARDSSDFADAGLPVVGDTVAGAGPLAGLHALLRQPRAPWCWLVACDMPRVDARLLTALWQARRPGALAIVPSTPDGGAGRLHPCAALYHADLAGAALAALTRGERAMHRWLTTVAHVEVPCDTAQLLNLNTTGDLTAWSVGAA